MARFRKTILTADKHYSPEGVVDATPARIRRWAAEHARMRAAGLKTPVCLGHHLSSIPFEDFDAAQEAGAKFNIGTFDELIAADNGNRLDAIISVPGGELDGEGNLLMWMRDPQSGNEFKSSISEVSAAITKNFRDGKKRDWNDIISHVAVTTYPVFTGQTGFQALNTKTEGTIFLSLGARGWQTLGTKQMADDTKKDPLDDDFDDDVSTEDEIAAADAGGGGLGEVDDDGNPEGAGGENADVTQLVDLLSRVLNVHLPHVTTKEELVHQLKVVVSHLDAAANGMETTGATADNNAPVVAEQTPTMMSLIRDNPDAKRLHDEATRLAESNKRFAQAEQGRHRKRAGKIVETLQSLLPPSLIEEIKPNAETICLSLTRDGSYVEPKEFTRTELYKLLIKVARGLPNARLTQTLSTARVHSNPLVQAIKQGEVSKQESSAMAHRIAGVPETNGDGHGKKRTGKRRRERV